MSLLSCEKPELDVLEVSEHFEDMDSSIVLEEEEAAFDQVYNWVSQMQLSNGLLESAENTNFVSLYDNSLASMIFIANGEFEKAEKIFEFFNSKIDAELLSNTGGFYQSRNTAGENGGRTWMGDNAWLLIALNNYHASAGNQKYQNLAQELENWIRSLQDTDGGLWGGFNENGTQIHKITEGIVTAFNAVEGYDDFHKNILIFLKEERWDATENLIVAWPENPDYNFAMDLHPLAFGIFEDFPVNSLFKTDRYVTTQIATVTGEEITGYCFDEDKDVIWLEGSAQMSVAFQKGDMHNEANTTILELEKTFITSTTLDNAEGLPYAANFGTSYGASLLWEHADITPAISSTVWYLFAKHNFNPLALGAQKNIPVADKFWLQALAN
ncbi:MAG: hypothetical protein COA50_03770 [Flavobacteriaceae bacterium]|nr:MAG: hypothetical protein COA50_03770 [Flavobacteriaceae bacterium]